MENIGSTLSKGQIETIVNSSYYHLKHYHELGNDDALYWISQINKVQEQVLGYLMGIIAQQRAREQEKLSHVFQGNCSIQSLIDSGMSQIAAERFYNSFSKGKNGDIQQQVEALNEIIQTTLLSESQATEDGLVQAAKVIDEIFNSSGSVTSAPQVKSLDEYGVFVSSLYAIAQRLSEQLAKETDIVKASLEAVLRRLNGALSYYKAEYQKKLQRKNAATNELNQLFLNMEQFISIKGQKSWSKHKLDSRSLDSVKAVLHRSASGYFRNQGGKKFEEVAGNDLLNEFKKVFSKTEIQVRDGKANITGLNPDVLNKQQKADIVLNFNLSTTTSASEQFSISFSVKKHESFGNIQVHHGGSLFAYANRFQAMGGAYGQDFEFLNDPNFQYVYVNELRAGGKSGEFLTAFKNMLQGVGFLFLGEEINDIGGADFLYIQGKIVAFSTILEKISLNNSAFSVTVSQTKKDVLSQKSALVSEENSDGKMYDSEFIKKSINIGKQAIYGTTFSINLKSSYQK